MPLMTFVPSIPGGAVYLIYIHKSQVNIQIVDWWLQWWGIGEGGQKVQNSSYKVNKFWGSNVQHGTYS